MKKINNNIDHQKKLMSYSMHIESEQNKIFQQFRSNNTNTNTSNSTHTEFEDDDEEEDSDIEDSFIVSNDITNNSIKIDINNSKMDTDQKTSLFPSIKSIKSLTSTLTNSLSSLSLSQLSSSDINNSNNKDRLRVASPSPIMGNMNEMKVHNLGGKKEQLIDELIDEFEFTTDDMVISNKNKQNVPEKIIEIPKLTESIIETKTFANMDDNIITDKLKKITPEMRMISKWVEDDSVAKCFQCSKEFTFILRRHHCRLCGRVFCYQCSNYFVTLPLDIMNKIPDKPQYITDIIWGDDLASQVRVCSSCYAYASKLIRLRKIIKVFEIAQLDIKQLLLLSEISQDWSDASKFCISKFREIQYKLSIDELTNKEKIMLWNNRNYLVGHSRWMIQLIKATDLNNSKNVEILEQLMAKNKVNSCWDIKCTRFCSETIGLTDMLDLIRYNRNHNVISTFIIKCLEPINNERLEKYLPFLVFNIRNNKFMLDTLIEKGVNDFRFMSNLYWSIKVYCVDNTDRKDYIVKLLTTIKQKCDKQFKYKFRSMIDMETIDFKKLNEIKEIVIPVCPNEIFTGVDSKNIKVMSSYSQPVIIPFISQNKSKKLIMFKNDDVRKDHIVLNMISIVHDILKNEDGLDIEMVKYDVIPTGKNTGYIEIVENASTIFSILENPGLTIQNYILNNNKDTSVRKFRERFIQSTALYCVISYLLGVGDRHLDNIMISKDGLLFHIDFGFILGQDPKYTNNRMIRVTPEIVNVIGGYGTEDYETFKKLCVRIYNTLRLHVNLFSNILSIIPYVDPTISFDTLKRELTERFEIGENCIEAATHMDNKVEKKNNFEYMLIDFLYKSKKTTIVKGLSYVASSIVNMIKSDKKQ